MESQHPPKHAPAVELQPQAAQRGGGTGLLGVFALLMVAAGSVAMLIAFVRLLGLYNNLGHHFSQHSEMAVFVSLIAFLAGAILVGLGAVSVAFLRLPASSARPLQIGLAALFVIGCVGGLISCYFLVNPKGPLMLAGGFGLLAAAVLSGSGLIALTVQKRR